MPKGIPVVQIWNKQDQSDAATAARCVEGLPEALLLSAKTGEGIETLRQRLLALAGWQPSGEGLFMARERHLQALARVDEHLNVAAAWLEAAAEHLDLLAEELRLAQQALGAITGEFSADDLLGEIFSRFCIGK